MEEIDSTIAISFDKNECEPRQVAFQPSKFSSLDLNTISRGNAVLCSVGHRCLSKLIEKRFCEIGGRENCRCLTDVTVLKGEDCVIQVVEVLKVKREPN